MCGRWVDVAPNGLVWEKSLKSARERERLYVRVCSQRRRDYVCVCVCVCAIRNGKTNVFCYRCGATARLRVVSRVFEERHDGVVEFGERVRGIESGGEETAEVCGELARRRLANFGDFFAFVSRRRRWWGW